TRFDCDWSSDVCSSDLVTLAVGMSLTFYIPWPTVDVANDRPSDLDVGGGFTGEPIAYGWSPFRRAHQCPGHGTHPSRSPPNAHQIGRASCRERVEEPVL